MTVRENVAYPLGKMPKSAQKEKVMEALRLVGLEELVDRPAPQLSGGQQQRVALARAIIRGAKLLLLDEPLSNLDAKLRGQMRVELRELQRRLGLTTIYVTHDQEEALAMSDRITILSDGQIVETGRPLDIYRRPRTLFTADFTGAINFLSARIVSRMGENRGLAKTSMGELECLVYKDVSDEVIIPIKPEHIQVLEAPPTLQEHKNVFSGTLVSTVFLGKVFECQVRVADQDITVRLRSTRDVAVGEKVYLYLPPEFCVAISAPSHTNLT